MGRNCRVNGKHLVVVDMDHCNLLKCNDACCGATSPSSSGLSNCDITWIRQEEEVIPIIEQRVVDATIIVGVEILLVIGHVFVKILVHIRF